MKRIRAVRVVSFQFRAGGM